MLVSHRKNFIFTKTVKTAGTSVEAYFEKWCMPEGEWQPLHVREEYVSDAGIIGKRADKPSDATWYNHMSAYNIRHLLGDDAWREYFKFTAVRNPFDKLVSGFFMFWKQKQANQLARSVDTRELEIEQFRRWIRFLYKLILKNQSLLDSPAVPHYLKPLELSLVDRDKYLIEGKECVDFFVRHEDFQKDIQQVCNILNIPYEAQQIQSLKKKVRYHKIPLREYFDQPSKRLVETIYSWEIERFGYDLPS